MFVKETKAQGYCNRLKSDPRNYSDKARGLTDAQKIEAQEEFARLATVPDARQADAVALYLEHMAQKTHSVALEDLGKKIVEERQALGGSGAGSRTIDEIEERWGRFPERTFWRLLESREIDKEVLGGRVKVRPSTIREYAARHKLARV